MKLEEKLTTLRKEKELSQQEVAEMLNTSRQTISRWESGSSVPSVDNLKSLGRIYEVPLDYLLHEDVPRPARHGEETDHEENEMQVRAAAQKRTREKRIILILGVLLAVSLAVNGMLAVIVYNYKSNELAFDQIQHEQLEDTGPEEFPFGW